MTPSAPYTENRETGAGHRHPSILKRGRWRESKLSELDAAVAALVQQRVAALFVAPQADFRNWRQQILALAEYQQVFRTVISSSLEV